MFIISNQHHISKCTSVSISRKTASRWWNLIVQRWSAAQFTHLSCRWKHQDIESKQKWLLELAEFSDKVSSKESVHCGMWSILLLQRLLGNIPCWKIQLEGVYCGYRVITIWWSLLINHLYLILIISKHFRETCQKLLGIQVNIYCIMTKHI